VAGELGADGGVVAAGHLPRRHQFGVQGPVVGFDVALGGVFLLENHIAGAEIPAADVRHGPGFTFGFLMPVGARCAAGDPGIHLEIFFAAFQRDVLIVGRLVPQAAGEVAVGALRLAAGHAVFFAELVAAADLDAERVGDDRAVHIGTDAALV